MNRKIRIFLLIMTPILVAAMAVFILRSPENDRQWDVAFSRAPIWLKIGKDKWHLSHMRNFTFHADGEVDPAWGDVVIDTGELKEVWFFLEPFESWDGVAHTLLSFNFEGDDPKTLSISIEARREVGEVYSGLHGAFNAYELIHVWSTEKDALTRIAVGLDHDLYAYRLNVSPEQAQAILNHFIHRTNELAERPRFYNTLTSNCTNELAKSVNDAFPGTLPWHHSHWLTGFSAKHLFDLKYLGSSNSEFAALTENANISQGVQAAGALQPQEFSSAWRENLINQPKSAPEKSN